MGLGWVGDGELLGVCVGRGQLLPSILLGGIAWDIPISFGIC